MTLQEIIDMDIDAVMKLNRAELAKVTQTIAKNVERRSKSVAKHFSQAPALRALEESGGKITTRGKNLNELRKDFVRGVNFLTAKTSTVKGAKEYKSRMEEIATGGLPMTPSQEKEFWSAVNKVIEEAGGREIIRQYGSDQIFEKIRVEVLMGEEIDPKRIIDALYEETAEQRGFKYEPLLSEFFEPEQ